MKPDIMDKTVKTTNEFFDMGRKTQHILLDKLRNLTPYKCTNDNTDAIKQIIDKKKKFHLSPC